MRVLEHEWAVTAWVETLAGPDTATLRLGGSWRLAHLAGLDRDLIAALARLLEAPPRRARIVADGLDQLDTAGGWLIVRTIRALEAARVTVELVGARPAHAALLELLRGSEAAPCDPPPRDHPWLRLVLRTGAGTVHAAQEGARFLSFAGAVTLSLLRQLLRPRTLRLTSIVHHIEQTGVNAIPIIAIMAFFIGIVLAYQGADQLRQFGAEIFTVNLVAVSTLRELGVLLTAIMVAGRSGSAFTAQIGTMKVNEELDAMEVIGLDRLAVLVTPRLVALAVSLPLLTFLANLMALVGGGLVVVLLLDIPTVLLLRQLQAAVGIDLFVAGMIKAPVFAVLIAAIGCYMGLQVEGNAESVGRLTTQSVVVSIFAVIVVDALFSMLFATFGI